MWVLLTFDSVDVRSLYQQCSSTCAGGFQRRVVVCQDENGYPANSCEDRSRPNEQRSCESGPCPQWIYGNWGEVRGTAASRWRSVIPRNSESLNPCCIRVMARGRVLESIILDKLLSSVCVCLIHLEEYPINHTKKRSNHVEMRTILVCPCCPQCTKPCGGGIKTRLVVCQRPNGERFNDLSCEIHDKPPDREQCNTQPCPSNPHWSADTWSSVRS